MSVVEALSPNAALKKFVPTDAAIAAMREEFMPLTIGGIDDVAGYRRVHSARMVVKYHRVEVEKVWKELKADALEYGRTVDAEVERITMLLEPIESRLADQENAIDNEKDRIKNAERDRLAAIERAKVVAEAARLKAAAREGAEKLRLQALRPDRIKLLSVADAVRDIQLPIVSPGAATKARERINVTLQATCEKIQQIIKDFLL